VLEVEDGASDDGGVWMQIQVAVIGGMLRFSVAGVGVLVMDLLLFSCAADLVFTFACFLRW
jgi:glucose dehydrogenase